MHEVETMVSVRDVSEQYRAIYSVLLMVVKVSFFVDMLLVSFLPLNLAGVMSKVCRSQKRAVISFWGRIGDE